VGPLVLVTTNSLLESKEQVIGCAAPELYHSQEYLHILIKSILEIARCLSKLLVLVIRFKKTVEASKVRCSACSCLNNGLQKKDVPSGEETEVGMPYGRKAMGALGTSLHV
jgi:hypothetical protein